MLYEVITVHAQDHIMTSMLAREMIEELIEIQRQLQGKEAKAAA